MSKPTLYVAGHTDWELHECVTLTHARRATRSEIIEALGIDYPEPHELSKKYKTLGTLIHSIRHIIDAALGLEDDTKETEMTVETRLYVEIVWGQFARLDVTSARVVNEQGDVVAACRHQHRTADAAFECGQRMRRRAFLREEQ